MRSRAEWVATMVSLGVPEGVAGAAFDEAREMEAEPLGVAERVAVALAIAAKMKAARLQVGRAS